MKATIIIDSNTSLELNASSVKVEDGFLKFKNASTNNSKEEEEAWILISNVKSIIWKDKPE